MNLADEPPIDHLEVHQSHLNSRFQYCPVYQLL